MHEQLILIKLLEQINEDQRIILVLADVEGYTLSELEQILGCSLGTLKSRLHQARSRLREFIEDNKLYISWFWFICS